MEELNKSYLMSEEAVKAETNRFMVKVYGWMSLALAITGFMSIYTVTTPSVLQFIFSSQMTFFGLLILELVLVGVLVGLVQKMSASTAIFVFIMYSIINGLTLSVVFLVYTAGSIASTFFITAGTFAAMSIYGYITKSDLTKLGNILVMALFGLIIASIVNIFLGSETLYWITTYAGVLIFTGLIAYDTQKIKNLNIIGNEGTDENKKEAIIGALTLYLDFINLFLMLLRLFGKRR